MKMVSKEASDYNSTIYNVVIILLAFVGTSMLCFFFRATLPHKFFIDNETIRQVMAGMPSNYTFTRVANIFEFLGLSSNSSVFSGQVLGMIVYVAVLVSLTVRFRDIFSKTSHIIILVVWSIMFAAFFTQMSKDLVTIVFVGVIPLVFARGVKSHTVLLYVCMVAYGLLFRQYWLAIFGFSLANYVRVNFLRRPKHPILMTLLFYFIMLVVVLIVYKQFTGQSILDVRVGVNGYRIDNGGSIILTPLQNGNIINEVFNLLYMLIALFLPLNVNAISQVLYFVWLYSVVGVVVVNYRRIRIENRRKFISSSLLYISFVISFFAVQLLFEPDLGSALRHQAAIFPEIMIILGRMGYIERNENNRAKTW